MEDTAAVAAWSRLHAQLGAREAALASVLEQHQAGHVTRLELVYEHEKLRVLRVLEEQAFRKAFGPQGGS